MNINFEKIVEITIGSGLALTLLSSIYFRIIKGRIKIEKDFLDLHHDKTKLRYRIKVKNKGFKTINNLSCVITIHNLNENDIYSGSDYSKYFISKGNFIPVIEELITWDINQTSIDLHPNLKVDLDICHFNLSEKTLEFPSELGYYDPNLNNSKSRVLITNINEFYLTLKFFAQDMRPKTYYFKITPNSDCSYLDIQREKHNQS